MKHVNIAAALVLCAFSVSASCQLRDLSSTEDGQGTLQFRTRSSTAEVRRAYVSLRRNGTAEIRAMSGADETFYGRWSIENNRECRISIERVGRDRASGGGRVQHDGRGRFTHIDLSGSVGSSRYE